MFAWLALFVASGLVRDQASTLVARGDGLDPIVTWISMTWQPDIWTEIT